MKHIARFLIRLYPATWRARYGDEFEALLEDSSSGWPACFDLLKGAIRMQLSLPVFPKLALVLSIVGLLAGLAISFVVTPRYVSEAGMAFEGTAAGAGFLEFLTQCENEVLSRASLKGVIQDPRLNLYPEERAGKPLEDVIETMRRNILIRRDGHRSDRLSFHIAFSYRDGAIAQHTIQALLVRFQDANLHLPAPVNLSVIDPPSLPSKAAFPDRWLFMAMGFGAGVAAAVLVAIFRRRTPPMPLPAQAA
jgi:hypothetical protein